MIKKNDIGKPSSFAKFCSKYITYKGTILDIGCGNGRDTYYFIKQGLTVFSFDKLPGFWKIDFKQLIKNKCFNIDYCYLRFVLHAMPAKLASKVLVWVYNVLRKDGLIFIEVRSIKDEIYGKGKKVDRDGYILDHYRRFVRKDELIRELEDIGFNIYYVIEKVGLSKMKDSNPCLIRIIGRK